MIIFRLDKLLKDKHMSISELSEQTELSEKDHRALLEGNVQAIRISTMNRLCEELECTPGELMDYEGPHY